MSAARIQRIAPGIRSLFRPSPAEAVYSRLQLSCSIAHLTSAPLSPALSAASTAASAAGSPAASAAIPAAPAVSAARVGFAESRTSPSISFPSCHPSSRPSSAFFQTTPAVSSPLCESTAVTRDVHQFRDSHPCFSAPSHIATSARRDSAPASVLASGSFFGPSSCSASQSRFTAASQGLSASPARSFAAASRFGMAAPTEIASNKMFGGVNKRYEHESATLGCTMKFSIYFPPAAASTRVPVIYWLSGLTCTDENFIQKSFAQKYASEHGVALIVPDTSPRGLKVEGESDNWDFGVGAGFYVNATVPKWKNWQMYDYITEELHRILSAHYTNLDMQRCSLMGHSMGGHGALIIFFRNGSKYKSVSAFAPICNPTECPWGQKAFSGYLGDDKAAWEEYDATELVKQYPGPKVDILIDQGDSDKFYHEKQLLPENFQKACTEAGVPLTLRFQGGYDHSYFFIASFIGDHIKHHAKALKA
ncbi:hypothetical protein CLOM_g7048 [Closterium sp. NIES-68]|nr:hypothetical protein CLOM_g7048 [Closterium sp. NIES-68]GJP62387.1 hypothetical protein CLOP_g19458 [Closterium sp. NIES-67]